MIWNILKLSWCFIVPFNKNSLCLISLIIFFFVRFSSVTLKYFFIYKFYEFFSVVDKDPTGPLKSDPHARFPTATCEISYAKWWSKGNPRFQFSHKLFFHYSETSQVTVQTGTWSEYDLQMNSDFFPVILAVNYSESFCPMLRNNTMNRKLPYLKLLSMLDSSNESTIHIKEVSSHLISRCLITFSVYSTFPSSW